MTGPGASLGARRSLFSDADARLRRRRAAERRFRAFGVVAVCVGLAFLAILAASIVRSGIPAFSRGVMEVEFTLDQEGYAAAEKELFKTKAYEKLLVAFLARELGDLGGGAIDAGALKRIVGKPGAAIRAHYRANEDTLGAPVAFRLAVSSRVDGYLKGRVSRETLQDSRFLKLSDLDLVDALRARGIVRSEFSWAFVTGADSAVDNPSAAGIGASVAGSLFMMIVVLGLSLPVGVAAAIYLEEFAAQNRFVDMIEVNISNLAAVPSIVFGILGLAVFIQFMHLPQSAPLVGGLVLTLMTLPTIIISTRAALHAVPPSIRSAALGLGASHMQAVFHHVLPLAMPGILTGTIIGLARALGETAPLLLIGMVGLVARGYPETFLGGFAEPNSAMPAQIYSWSTRADPAFYEKAWGGIIVLLAFLLCMNAAAVILRHRFERRW